ncbi:uncharacterized protein METZ01_LOCUS422875, partial [marine metagenome]
AAHAAASHRSQSAGQGIDGDHGRHDCVFPATHAGDDANRPHHGMCPSADPVGGTISSTARGIAQKRPTSSTYL